MPFNPLYNFNQAHTELKYRLGNRSDLGEGSQDRISMWLNSAQLRIAGSVIENPDLDVAGFPMTTIDGQSEYSLLEILPPATNVVGIKQVRNNTTQVKCRRFSWNEYRTLSQQAPGPPMRWARWGYIIAFDPQPNLTTGGDNYEILLDYRRMPVYDTTEIPNIFQEDWLHLAESYGWQALMKLDRAQAAASRISANLQVLLNQELDQNQWESLWDTDQTIAPYGFDYPYSVG
jgi:hypothetical protein